MAFEQILVPDVDVAIDSPKGNPFKASAHGGHLDSIVIQHSDVVLQTPYQDLAIFHPSENQVLQRVVNVYDLVIVATGNRRPFVHVLFHITLLEVLVLVVSQHSHGAKRDRSTVVSSLLHHQEAHFELVRRLGVVEDGDGIQSDHYETLYDFRGIISLLPSFHPSPVILLSIGQLKLCLDFTLLGSLGAQYHNVLSRRGNASTDDDCACEPVVDEHCRRVVQAARD